MRAPVSIVIPTLNSGADLPETLASLGVGLQAELIRELVVSDGGSGDDTLSQSNSVGAVLISGKAGRGGQLARGADAARGEWLLFLHADTWLDECWPHAISQHLSKYPDSAGYFRLAFRSDGMMPRFVAGWANLRSRLFDLPYGDQGLLVSRTLYEKVGGYRDIPLMEDVAMALSLRGRLRPLSARAQTSAGRYQRKGWLRQGFHNLTILVRYLLGADPELLSRSYTR